MVLTMLKGRIKYVEVVVMQDTYVLAMEKAGGGEEVAQTFPTLKRMGGGGHKMFYPGGNVAPKFWHFNFF